MGFLGKRYNVDTGILDLTDVYSDDYWQANQPRLNISYKEDVQALAKVLGDKVPNLQFLSLNNNRLRYCSQFEAMVQALPDVKFLSIEENAIEKAIDISTVFGRWKNCEGIMVNKNPFSRDMTQAALGAEMKRNGRFPALRTINDVDIPESIGFDLTAAAPGSETIKTLPDRHPVGVATEDEEVKGPIEGFLSDFVTAFDDQASREKLYTYYHEKAAFSLVTQAVKKHEQTEDNDISHLFQMSRKLNLMGRGPRTEIQHGRLKVLSFLSDLPNTKHAFEALVFDVAFRTEDFLHLSFSGELYEEGKRQGQFFTRDFSRSLVVVPSENAQNGHGLLITNDILVLRARPSKQPQAPREGTPLMGATPAAHGDETAAILALAKQQAAPEISVNDKAALSAKFSQGLGIPLETAVNILRQCNWNQQHASNCGKLTTELSIGADQAASILIHCDWDVDRGKMVAQFMKDSGMKPEYCAQCLGAKNWDYTQAGSYYMEIKQQGSIKPEMLL